MFLVVDEGQKLIRNFVILRKDNIRLELENAVRAIRLNGLIIELHILWFEAQSASNGARRVAKDPLTQTPGVVS